MEAFKSDQFEFLTKELRTWQAIFGILVPIYFLGTIYLILLYPGDPLIISFYILTTMVFLVCLIFSNYCLNHMDIFKRDPDLGFRDRPVNKLHRKIIKGRLTGIFKKNDHPVNYQKTDDFEVRVKRNRLNRFVPSLYFILITTYFIMFSLLLFDMEGRDSTIFSMTISPLLLTLIIIGVELKIVRYVGYSRRTLLFQYAHKLVEVPLRRISSIELRGSGKHRAEHLILGKRRTVSMEFIDKDMVEEIKNFYQGYRKHISG